MMIKMLLMILMSGQDKQVDTFAFAELTDDQHWVVNDSVMGGRSNSKITHSNNTLTFSGSVSLENNGGFASIRMVWPFTVSNESTEPHILSLKVSGDGSLYQFRLRTNKGIDGAAYTYSFATLAGQEQTVNISLNDFIPIFRGQTLKNMPELKLSDVQQMGVLVADKQAGDFSIDLIHLSLQ